MNGRLAIGIAALAVLASGCGLKGSLEMPEKSTNVVIRGPRTPPADAGTTVPSEPPPTTGETATPAGPSTPQAPKDDRLPPPPLPGGNAGSARGG